MSEVKTFVMHPNYHNISSGERKKLLSQLGQQAGGKKSTKKKVDKLKMMKLREDLKIISNKYSKIFGQYKRKKEDNEPEFNTLCITPTKDVDGFEDTIKDMKKRPKSESFVRNLIVIEDKMNTQLADLPKIVEKKKRKSTIKSSSNLGFVPKKKVPMDSNRARTGKEEK